MLWGALVAIGPLVAAACYSPERYAELRKERSVDIDEEMDILFACAEAAVRQRDGVEYASEVARRVRGNWQLDPTADPVERRQLVVQVIVDPMMGPGVVARHVRQRWQGEGEPPGREEQVSMGHAGALEDWTAANVSAQDRERERVLVEATRSCWEEESRHGGRRQRAGR